MLQMIVWELWNGGHLCCKGKDVEKEAQKGLVCSNG
jgi:hypothetical protein